MSENVVLEGIQISALIVTMADQIIEKCEDLHQLVLVGILTKGMPLAERLGKLLSEKTGVSIPVGALDVALYRDDVIGQSKFISVKQSQIPCDLTGKKVILVDDVCFHGRTVRAALDALLDYGRPSVVEVAVLIDRGYRELPICANYIGQVVKTEQKDHIRVHFKELSGEDRVIVLEQ